MSVGFVVKCNKCKKRIVETDGFEKDSFEKLNIQLGEVTDGFIGIGAGQAEIERCEDMYKLAAFPMFCSKDCRTDNWVSDLKKFWYEKIRK